MSGLKAKMHHIRFPPQIPLGELTALPRPTSCIRGGLLLRGVRGKDWRGGEGKGRERKGEDMVVESCPAPNWGVESGSASFCLIDSFELNCLF